MPAVGPAHPVAPSPAHSVAAEEEQVRVDNGPEPELHDAVAATAVP